MSSPRDAPRRSVVRSRRCVKRRGARTGLLLPFSLSQPTPAVRTRWRHLAHLVLSLVILVLLVLYARTVHWGSVWHAVAGASLPLLLLSALANLISLGAKALIWWIFLRRAGAPSLELAVRATAAGAALNNLLVANSGDAARAVLVARRSDATAPGVLAALTLERLFDLVGYVLIVALAAELLPMPDAVARWRTGALLLLAVIALLLWLLVRRTPEVPSPRAHVPTRLLARAHAFLGHYFSNLSAMITRRALGVSFLLTIVNWGGQIASYHLAALATHLPLTLTGTIAAMLTSNVGFLLRATPGNVGVFQAVYALTAQALGASRDQAVGTALLLQVAQGVPVTLLGAALAPDLIVNAGRQSGPPTVGTGDAQPGG